MVYRVSAISNQFNSFNAFIVLEQLFKSKWLQQTDNANNKLYLAAIEL